MTACRSTKPVTALEEPIIGSLAASVKVSGVHEGTTDRARADSKQMSGDPRQTATDFRNELLDREWPDAVGMSALRGVQWGPYEANCYAASLREQRTLLGVWSIRDRTFRYPEFQFDKSGQLRSDVAGLLANLPDSNDRGGWRRAFWLYSPHAKLNGAPPAEVFVTNPDQVIAVAKQEFDGDRDASW